MLISIFIKIYEKNKVKIIHKHGEYVKVKGVFISLAKYKKFISNKAAKKLSSFLILIASNNNMNTYISL